MTIHDDAIAAFQKVYDDALWARADERDAERARANTEAARADQLQAELDAARARIAELEAAQKPPAPTETTRQALTAVRVFPHYAGKNYGDHDKVLTILSDLGIKRISGLLTPDLNAADFYRRAHDQHGIKTWFTVGQPRVTLTAAEWDTLEKWARSNTDLIDLASGWNEPNHVRGGGTLPTDWADQTAKHQTELYRRLSRLVRVGSPQLWSGNLATHDTDLAALAPKIRGQFHVTTWHLYPRGDLGLDLLARFEKTYAGHFPGTPIVCTEAGYFTDPTYTGGAKVVTETQQADLIPQLAAAYINKGYGLSYFELLDDPAGGREGTFGLCHPDGTPKPAYHTLRNYLTTT